jgi:ribokinase
MSDVVVVGSVNLDRVQTVARLPAPGDTIHGRSFATYFGGKGANQAVAAARMGASVRFVGRVGRDDAGADLREALVAEGIDDRSLLSVDGPTGFATILVSAAGENVIVLEAGANGRFTPSTLAADDLAGARVALFQMEVPFETVVRGLELARAAGAITVLNAAPPEGAERVPPSLVDVLVVNEGEAALLSRTLHEEALPGRLLERLAERYASVVLTLGAHGVLWAHDGARGAHPSHRVDVVDTTAAGDTFTGAFAAGVAAGRPWADAIAFAVTAAALCVTRPGAQASIPTRAEVEAFVPRP